MKAQIVRTEQGFESTTPNCTSMLPMYVCCLGQQRRVEEKKYDDDELECAEENNNKKTIFYNKKYLRYFFMYTRILARVKFARSSSGLCPIGNISKSRP